MSKKRSTGEDKVAVVKIESDVVASATLGRGSLRGISEEEENAGNSRIHKRAKVFVKLEEGEERASKESGIEIDVSDDNLKRIINVVNEKASEKGDEGSDNCEVQAARVVWALQGKDCSGVNMINQGIRYQLPGKNEHGWGFLQDSQTVEDSYAGLIAPTQVNDMTEQDQVIDISHETCITDVKNKDNADKCLKEQGYGNWGLMGLNLNGGWHQVVWIKRENDVVICDPNRPGGELATLESYPDLEGVSILKFAKGYRPSEVHVQKKAKVS